MVKNKYRKTFREGYLVEVVGPVPALLLREEVLRTSLSKYKDVFPDALNVNPKYLVLSLY